MTQMVKQKLGLDNNDKSGDNVNMGDKVIKKTIEEEALAIAQALKAQQTFNPTVVAYAIYEIAGTGKYDIMKISVDTSTDKTTITRLGKSFDSETRAIYDRQMLEAQDLVAKRKEEMRQHRELLKKLKEEGK